MDCSGIISPVQFHRKKALSAHGSKGSQKLFLTTGGGESMGNLTSAKLKSFAEKVGVDVTGVASIDRFEGAPAERHPASLYPDAKSVITIGFRITRGSLRGIEEGSDWSAYNFMSYGGIVMLYSVIAQREISRFIEDFGYEAVPYMHTGAKELGSPVERGRPRPDIKLNERFLAVAAGLGEIGYSRMFLSPVFGPAIRVFPILTDAPLKPDPVFKKSVCDECGICLAECPSGALNAEDSEDIKIVGQTYRTAGLDLAKCAWSHHGGQRAVSPFTPYDIEVEGYPLYNEKLLKVPYYGVHDKQMGHLAVCGALGCIRGWLIHLEEKKKIFRTFKNKFRRRKPWWPLAPSWDEFRNM